MPQVAITIAYDANGSPSLLADTRTPADEQRRQLGRIKAGAAAPDGATRIEFVEWSTVLVPCWIKPASASEATAETKKPTKKEKSK